MDAGVVEPILKECRPLLYRELVLSPTVIDMLKKEDIITEAASKKLNELDSPGQITYLIEILRKRGVRTFRKFLRVLMETFHGSLAEQLVSKDPERFSDLLTPGGDGDPEKPCPELEEDRRPEPLPAKPNPVKLDQLETESMKKQVIGPQDRVKSDVEDDLRDLRTYFDYQQSNTGKALSALKQEEVVIRELLDQNAREQDQFRQNQSSLEEIGRRVQQISMRTGSLADAYPRLSVSHYRLAQLNNLPWSAGKRDY